MFRSCRPSSGLARPTPARRPRTRSRNGGKIAGGEHKKNQLLVLLVSAVVPYVQAQHGAAMTQDGDNSPHCSDIQMMHALLFIG